MNFYVFLPNRKGHFDDYFGLLKNILPGHNVISVRNAKEKLSIALFKRKDGVIFLDGDSKDFPLVILRSLVTKNSFSISVATSRLLNKKMINQSFKENIKAIQNWIKYNFFKVAKRTNRHKLISIFKDTPYQESLSKIVSFFTYDPQAYDLQFSGIKTETPRELATGTWANKESIVIFNVADTRRRNPEKLKQFMQTTKRYQFILVGNASFLDGAKIDNLTHIGRYVSNEELIYLLGFCDIVYCFYTNNQPSSFMGRAMQLNKFVVVPKNSYLGSINYYKSLKVDELEELEDIKFETFGNKLVENIFDDAANLRNYLLQEMHWTA